MSALPSTPSGCWLLISGTSWKLSFPGSTTRKSSPCAAQLTQLVVDNPDQRSLFEEEFRGLIHSENFGMLEIVQYSVHVLRWPSVRSAVEFARYEVSDGRRQYVLMRVLEAFDDDWEEREVFERFRGRAEG